MECFDPEVVVWLYEHGRHHTLAQLRPMNIWKSDACFRALQQCMAYEDQDYSFVIFCPENAVDAVIESGRLDYLQWLYEYRPQLFESQHFSHAVRLGGLEIAKWLQQTFPKQFFDDSRGEFDGYGYCRQQCVYTIDMTQYLICEYTWKYEDHRYDWMDNAMEYAAAAGKWHMLEFVYMKQLETRKAAEGIPAEKKCHLVLSPAIMDNSAANGHLDAVKWLHENRSEGCTKFAMDGA